MKNLFLIIFSLLVVSLFVLAQEPTSTPPTSTPPTSTPPTSTPPTSTPPTSTPTPPRGTQIDLACMKNAVEKRENDLKTARETYFSKINQAYEERKTALLNAWSIANHKERQKAIHSAWSNFRKNVNSAKTEYRKAHLRIWRNFVQDRKNCRFGPTGENPGIDINF